MMSLSSGANAQRGDTVAQRSTGKMGTVTSTSQFGCIIVNTSNENGCHFEKWERWDTIIIRKE